MINTQLNKELLDYNCQRDTLKEEYRLLREAPMTSEPKLAFKQLRKVKIAMAGVNKGESRGK